MALSDQQTKLLLERVSQLERRLEVLETQESMEPWHNPIDWIEETQHPEGTLGGYVIDEGVARATPCKCISLSSGSELCFSKGIVGALDKNQRILYCQSVETVKASP